MSFRCEEREVWSSHGESCLPFDLQYKTQGFSCLDLSCTVLYLCEYEMSLHL
jgi:hypothetical protein